MYKDMWKEMLINHLKLSPNAFQSTIYLEDNKPNENIIFVSDDGSIYRKVFSGGRGRWVILANKEYGVGWYYTDSKNVTSDFGKVKLSNDKYAHTYPLYSSLEAFNIDNINYLLISTNMCDNDIKLVLHMDDKNQTKVGYMFPLTNNSNKWFDPDEENVNNECYQSYPLKGLPIHDFDSNQQINYKMNPFDLYFNWEEHPCQNNDPEYTDNVPNENTEIPKWVNDNLEWVNNIPMNPNSNIEIEKRIDPFDNEWYTKDEFIEYYGDSKFWDILCPDKVFRRTMLEIILIRNKESLRDDNINYLLDKMIETFT